MIFPRNFSRLIWGLMLILTCIVSRAADFPTTQLNRALAVQDTQYTYTDTCVALRIQWVGGTQGLASVAGTGSGDLTFLNAAGTADVTVVASTGVVAAATYTTFGKMADVINKGVTGLGSNWKCTLVGVRPSQSTGSTALPNFSADTTHISLPEGLAVCYKTSVLKMVSAVAGPEWMPNAMLTVAGNDLWNRRSWAQGTPAGLLYQNELLYVNANLTFSTGASTLYVYAVKDDSDGATELLLWQQAGSNTTAACTIPILPRQAPIKAPLGWRIVVQYIGSGTTTAGTLQLNGCTYPMGQGS